MGFVLRLICTLGVYLVMLGPALAGIDQVFTKPADKWSWGEIFEWSTGASGFGRSYALVIGISDYTGGFQALQATKNDPFRMKDFLIKEAGFDRVHVLTDEKASLDRIRQLMVGELAGLVQPEDRFLFYWSGHGTQTKDALNRPVGYLPLAASKPGQFWSMVSMENLIEWDRWIKARHALFLLDSCFSGLAGAEAQSTSTDFSIERLSKKAHHLITAGTSGEQTIAGERWEGSIFTDSILRAARGEADTETAAFSRDGVVNLAEILAYVRRRVDIERRTASWDKAITPQWSHLRSNEGEFFFVTSEKKMEVAKRQGEPTGALDSGMPIVEPLGAGRADSDAAARPPCDPSADRLYWESIKDEAQAAYFESYLAKAEAGQICGLFADLARLKIQAVTASPPEPEIEIAALQPPEAPVPREPVEADVPKEPAQPEATPEQMEQMQEMLTELGFDPGASDGVLGAKTRDAIVRFQQSIGADPTGSLTEQQEAILAKMHHELPKPRVSAEVPVVEPVAEEPASAPTLLAKPVAEEPASAPTLLAKLTEGPQLPVGTTLTYHCKGTTDGQRVLTLVGAENDLLLWRRDDGKFWTLEPTRYLPTNLARCQDWGDGKEMRVQSINDANFAGLEELVPGQRYRGRVTERRGLKSWTWDYYHIGVGERETIDHELLGRIDTVSVRERRKIVGRNYRSDSTFVVSVNPRIKLSWTYVDNKNKDFRCALWSVEHKTLAVVSKPLSCSTSGN